ncbi:MAG: cytidine deaminase [Chloroflexota bacterium]|nr:cytidine deaminase [Chloroflexota bacterium]MDE2858171.1 cytidine deaminase [Chloroflexota bacterium]
MSHPAEAELIKAAIAASEMAYIPYSDYRVGAALLTLDGDVYTGCNVESASYSPTICAERTALVKAISEGKREFSAVAVVTRDGGSPCGVCRQLLYEFSPGMIVIMADLEGAVHQRSTLAELLPFGFGPANLQG